MKTLKLDHERAQAVRNGRKNVTWRLNDDKNLSIDDRIQLIDKVDSNNPRTWLVIGEAVIDEIITKHLGDITKADMVGHEKYSTPEDMYAEYQKFYGDNVGPATPVKIIHFEFAPYGEAVAFNPEMLTNPQEVKIFADGGSRGNPGPSAAGYAVFDMQDKLLKKEGIYLGLTTNNQAEYQAVKLGLETLKKMGSRTVHVYLDSLLVVNQMKGIFKVKNRDLIPVHQGLRELVDQFEKVEFNHVPREFNTVADGMVNEALDKVAASG